MTNIINFPSNKVQVPVRRTASLNAQDTKKVLSAAAKAVDDLKDSAEVEGLLKKKARWALKTLEERVTADSAKIIAALRRVELVELEVARSDARFHVAENISAFSQEMLDAMDTPLKVGGNIDNALRAHRKAVVDGLRLLQRLQKDAEASEKSKAG